MIHSVDPRQNRLFDPFHGVIPPVGRRIIAQGWQGVFRHVLLEVMPVPQLAAHLRDQPAQEILKVFVYRVEGLKIFFGFDINLS